MKKKIFYIILLLIPVACNAGWNGTTVHSRANCDPNLGVNESITWWFLHPHQWRIVSFHYPNVLNRNISHANNTGYAFVWRQAVVHWGESFPSNGHYYVYGYHYYWDEYFNKEVYDANTEATNCNLYDGWWDKN